MNTSLVFAVAVMFKELFVMGVNGRKLQLLPYLLIYIDANSN